MDADVIVLGGGNAALCAAISARHEGVRVMVLERAPYHMRGGNTRHTRDIRYAHLAADYFTTGTYSDQEFMDDLLRVTDNETDLELAELTIRESHSLPRWMADHGVRWQEPLRGTLHLSRTNGFFLGGGKAMLNTYYDTAKKMGVEIVYDAKALRLEAAGGTIDAVIAEIDGVERRLAARAVVCATGGFEANISWLKRYWGDTADGFIIRGTPYNDGTALAALYDAGADAVGDPKGFHAVAVDARAPKFDGGIITRVDAIPFGIVVNDACERFYDEGEDLWPKRYAIWGGLIAGQHQQRAYAIYDAKTYGRFIPTLFPALRADSIGALAELAGLDPASLSRTVGAYNAACDPRATFTPGVLDGCATTNLQPPKSNWALPIDAPPFYCYPVKPGITFTYLGVKVASDARIVRSGGAPFGNLFAAGECMAGNILTRGYLAGFGLTIGSVFGRIAGKGAGIYARS